MIVEPGRKLERALLRAGHETVAGVDEVGRGAWAGPLSVGVALLDVKALRKIPAGVRDSKMLSPRQRSALFAPLATALRGFAVGHASSHECDELGMTAAQRLAARRALAALPLVPDAVLVDGNFEFTGHPRATTIIGGDRTSISVAAASVLAKVTRDALMTELSGEFPPYRFEENKGYPSPVHKEALRRVGLSSIHRKSWSFAATLGI